MKRFKRKIALCKAAKLSGKHWIISKLRRFGNNKGFIKVILQIEYYHTNNKYNKEFVASYITD